MRNKLKADWSMSFHLLKTTLEIKYFYCMINNTVISKPKLRFDWQVRLILKKLKTQIDFTLRTTASCLRLYQKSLNAHMRYGKNRHSRPWPECQGTLPCGNHHQMFHDLTRWECHARSFLPTPSALQVTNNESSCEENDC